MRFGVDGKELNTVTPSSTVAYCVYTVYAGVLSTGPKHPPAGRKPAGPTQDTPGQQPCHFIPPSGTHFQTRFGALVRAERVGGGLSSPPAQPMGPPRAMGTQ